MCTIMCTCLFSTMLWCCPYANANGSSNVRRNGMWSNGRPYANAMCRSTMCSTPDAMCCPTMCPTTNAMCCSTMRTNAMCCSTMWTNGTHGTNGTTRNARYDGIYGTHGTNGTSWYARSSSTTMCSNLCPLVGCHQSITT